MRATFADCGVVRLDRAFAPRRPPACARSCGATRSAAPRSGRRELEGPQAQPRLRRGLPQPRGPGRSTPSSATTAGGHPARGPRSWSPRPAPGPGCCPTAGTWTAASSSRPGPCSRSSCSPSSARSGPAAGARCCSRGRTGWWTATGRRSRHRPRAARPTGTRSCAATHRSATCCGARPSPRAGGRWWAGATTSRACRWRWSSSRARPATWSITHLHVFHSISPNTAAVPRQMLAKAVFAA